MNEMWHRERVGMRKVGAIDGFKFFSWQCLDDSIVKLTGGVPYGTISKGPRKGSPRSWRDQRTVYVTEAEVLAERARYEAATGKCGECLGTGKVVQRIDFVAGVTDYRECRICSGSGQFASPPAVDAVDPVKAEGRSDQAPTPTRV
jgi:hypothetical protein